MNVLFSIHLFPPKHLAGAEMMAHAIIKDFQAKGHTCKVLLWQGKQYGIENMYVWDDIDVFPAEDKTTSDLFYWCDVVFTHLGYTRNSIFLAAINNKPCFHLVHNTHKYDSIKDAEKKQFIVYNTEESKRLLNYEHEGFVLHPPVDYRHYEGEIGDAITLINLNENKGADIFYRLAEHFPKRRFIGVGGSYDDQLTGKILEYTDYKMKSAEGIFKKVTKVDKTPGNVEIWGKQTDMRKVYRQTNILLMPSRYESYGRTATEAMSSGIPVICNATFGLIENCGYAGIYIQDRDNLEEWIRAIEMLDKKVNYEKASRKARERAMEHDPREAFDKFEKWVREKANK